MGVPCREPGLLPRIEVPLRLVLVVALLLGARALPADAKASRDAGRSGAPSRPFATGKLVWPELKAVDEVDVPGMSIVDGREVHLHALRVKGSVEDLFGQYYRAFQRAGFFLPPQQKLSQLSKLEVGLAALDIAGEHSYVVILQPNGRRNDTTVVLGTIDLSRPLVPDAVDGIPVPPATRALVRASSEGGDVVHFEVSSSAEQLLAFYRDALGRAGFHEDKASPGAAGPRFLRGGQELEIRLAPVSGGRRTNAVILMHGGGPSPQGMDAAVHAAQSELESRAAGH